MTRPKVGDWISFYRDGTIKYSEVRYIRHVIGRCDDLCTPDGAVPVDSVLETRALLKDDDE